MYYCYYGIHREQKPSLQRRYVDLKLCKNNNYRHNAYRYYIYFKIGLLGCGVRKVIPSCVVLEVRRRWPDPNGLYSGHVRELTSCNVTTRDSGRGGCSSSSC